MWLLRSWLALWLTVQCAGIGAHEIRPAYLSLSEESPGELLVLWKVPTRGGAVLDLQPRLPEFCSATSVPAQRLVPGALVRQWNLRCLEPLPGATITVDGLQSTLTDVLLRIEDHSGASHTARLTPSAPTYVIPDSQSTLQLAGTYLLLGVEHIVLGVDHLLFVLALLLIVSGPRVLVITVTAFTVAHSLTLAAATLGYLGLAQAPVEATIALSILFLASEIVQMQKGRVGLAARKPWVVAFAFGLLHGFGFAGALADVGLPQNAIPLALLFFNVGVELGQLLFVALVLMLGWLVRGRLQQGMLARAELVTVYFIGSLAAYWTLQRVSGF